MRRWRCIYILVQVPTLVNMLIAYQWFGSGVAPLLARQWPLVGCFLIIVAASRGMIRRSTLQRSLLSVAILFECAALVINLTLDLLAALSPSAHVPDLVPTIIAWSTWVAVCEVSYGLALYLLVPRNKAAGGALRRQRPKR